MDGPVVAAVDLSEPSRVALARAAALATSLAAPLLVVHASQVPQVPAYQMSLGASHEERSRIEQDTQTARRAQLDDWVAPMRQQGIDVDVLVGAGPPPDLVAATAARHGARFIVVGRHGHSGARRPVLGSVAHAILRKSAVPVLVVPSR